MIKYTIINSAVNMVENPENKTVLKTIHNAGFFSCLTIRLLDIIGYYDDHGIPDEVDSSEQFLHYKSYPGENMVPYYFNQEFEQIPIPEGHQVSIRKDCMALQFDSYKNLDFIGLKPFVFKYFSPGSDVLEFMTGLLIRYKLNFGSLCAVFYRGNDKEKEMKIAPYEMFIEKAREIKGNNPEVRFLVQPDEKEFLEAFLKEFPDSIYFEETPMLSKQNSSVFYELALHERGKYGAMFFAAVLCMSRCKHVITHSGNGALWLTLYRGNADNIHQVFNDHWL